MTVEIKKPISWKEFLGTLSEEDLIQISRDYELFVKQSVIGECFLRSKANEWGNNIGCTHNVIMIMHDLAFYAYQYFANLYFAEHILSND